MTSLLYIQPVSKEWTENKIKILLANAEVSAHILYVVEAQRRPPACVLQRLGGERFIMSVDETGRKHGSLAYLYIQEFIISLY